MKYIHYLFLVVVFLLALETTQVFAETNQFYEGEAVTGAYLKKFKPGAVTGKYEQMRIFRRVGDNAPGYCIELWETLHSYQDIPFYQDNYASIAGISEESWRRIQLISYYGYGYGDHTEDRWYAASQFLIWKTLEPDSTIYFTDTLNGTRTSKFENEMAEIERLVQRHFVVPSFALESKKEAFQKNHLYSYLDTNQVLQDFEVSTTDKNVSYQVNGNTLQIEVAEPGRYSFSLQKKKEANRTLLYVSSSGQDLIVRGDYPSVSTTFHFEVEGGVFRFRKIDKDTKSTKPQGMASFAGTKYGLYDQSHQFIETIEIKEKEEFVYSSTLPYGVYYVKELESGKGYKLDPVEHKITLDQKEITIELEDEVYQENIIIHKSYGNGNIWKKEYQAEFEVYDFENHLYATISTDEVGTCEISLPYGHYRFHQTKGMKNYELVDDFFVDVTETSPKELVFELKNPAISRYLKIIKKDKETGNPIIYGPAQFKIFNLDTMSYVSMEINGKKETIFETDSHGVFLSFQPLPVGNYRLDEVKAPLGYQPLQEGILFSIDDTIEYTEEEGYGKTIVIEVFNSEKKGNLTLHKLGEKMDFTQQGISYSYSPLEKISFEVYALEDIVLGDGTLLYSKDALIQTIVTDAQGNVSISLPCGKYYVKEVTETSYYKENSKRYTFEICDDNLAVDLTITNYLKKGTLQIEKIDASTGKPLSDAVFAIYTEEGNFVLRFTTSLDGTFSFEELPLGKYYLIEEKSPFGYRQNNEKIFFEIKEDNEKISFSISNYPNHELPPKTDVSISKKGVKKILLSEIWVGTFGFFLYDSLHRKRKKRKEYC